MKAGAARVPSRFHGSECLSKVGERACCEAANDIRDYISNSGSHLMQRLERSVRFHTHLHDVFPVNAEEK